MAQEFKYVNCYAPTYSGAGSNYSISGYAKQNERVEILSNASNGYLNIERNSGAQAWINENYLDTKPSADFYDYDGYGVNCEYGYYSTNMKKYHIGVDLDDNDDKSVRAIAPGVVVEQKYTSANGNYIILEHDLDGLNKFYSFYAHMDSWTGLQVDVGDYVLPGTILHTKMGSTGSNSTGVHIHLGIYSGILSTSPWGWSETEPNPTSVMSNRCYYNFKDVLATKGKNI